MLGASARPPSTCRAAKCSPPCRPAPSTPPTGSARTTTWPPASAQGARFYYYPGWQEPQAAIELLINRKAWDALPADLQAIVEEAARGATQLMLDEYEYNNALALAELRRQGVVFKRFPDQVLAALHHEAEQVLEQLARQNELNGRIRASLQTFREQSGALHRLTEKELYNWR